MSIEKCMSSARTPAEYYVNKTEHKQKTNPLPKTLHTHDLYIGRGNLAPTNGSTHHLSVDRTLALSSQVVQIQCAITVV